MHSPDPFPEGSQFSAFCSAQSGALPLHFQWLKNERIISSDSHIQIVSLDEMQSNLKIKKVNASDSGNYTCTVRNSHGIDSQTVKLIVKGKKASYFLLQR